MMEDIAEMTDQPSLSDFITKEPWLIFDIFVQWKGVARWRLFPPKFWKLDPDYIAFRDSNKSLSVESRKIGTGKQKKNKN